MRRDSGFEPRRPQQKRRQVRGVARLVALLARRTRTWARRIQRGDGGRRLPLAVALPLARMVAVPLALRPVGARLAAATATAPATVAGRFVVLGVGGGRRVAGPGDRLSDQPLDRADRLLIGRRHDGDGGAAAARPAGAADAVDVVIGVV